MDRPFSKAKIEELEDLLTRHRSQRVVLARLGAELKFRRTDRAKQLRREVEGLLNGSVPMPTKPGRAARLEDQLPLIRD